MRTSSHRADWRDSRLNISTILSPLKKGFHDGGTLNTYGIEKNMQKIDLREPPRLQVSVCNGRGRSIGAGRHSPKESTQGTWRADETCFCFRKHEEAEAGGQA